MRKRNWVCLDWTTFNLQKRLIWMFIRGKERQQEHETISRFSRFKIITWKRFLVTRIEKKNVDPRTTNYWTLLWSPSYAVIQFHERLGGHPHHPEHNLKLGRVVIKILRKASFFWFLWLEWKDLDHLIDHFGHGLDLKLKLLDKITEIKHNADQINSWIPRYGKRARCLKCSHSNWKFGSSSQNICDRAKILERDSILHNEESEYTRYLHLKEKKKVTWSDNVSNFE